MTNYAYWAESLTGGTAGCLDAIDGTDLTDKDMAIVASSTAGSGYLYWLDEDNAGTESSPTIIAPDTAGGNKRWVLAGMIFPNTGLKVLDTNSSHTLNIKPGSDLTADRILTVTTGDAARTVTLNGNPTLDDWFDQNVKTTGTPQFARAGFGVAADANAILYAPNATYANTALFERSGMTTNIPGGAVRVLATKTSDMANGFGSALTFNIRDDAGVINILGNFGCVRSGGDTTGTFFIQTGKAGVYVDKFTIDSDGNAILPLGTLTLINTGLHLLDTNASHDLIVKPGSDLTADRTLTITTGDANRTLTVGASARTDVDQAITIASDVATVTAPGRATLTSASGVTDDLTAIVGLLAPERLSLKAAAGHTITVKSGANMVLQGDIGFPLSGNRRLVLESDDGTVCVELSRTRD